MQKIYFRKMIDLHHQLKELISVAVDESINYKMENQGMRAFGSIMINGEYKDDNEKKAFHDTIDLDILAQFSKIEDKKDYCVKVEDFDYTFVDGNLSLVIQACIYGVRDDEDRVIETDVVIPKEVVEDNVSEDVEDLLREQEEATELEQQDMMNKMNLEPLLSDMPQVQTNKSQVKEEPIEEDNEDMGTYYLYVVQDGDSYQSIAARYQVDEYQIKSYNHDRSLSKGTIVIIPYYS